MAKQQSNIWTELDALAAALDCGRDLAEVTLNRLETELMTLPSRERNETRRKMIFIVAQLSRLEVRMMANSGPRTPI
jgi:hypothetical protein